MSLLVGAAVSASMRSLLSINLGPFVGLTSCQALVFNSLDMIISSLATFLLAKMGMNENKQLIFGRGLGFIASLVITSSTLGPVSILVALVISGISQFVGLFVKAGIRDGASDTSGVV